MDTGHWTLCPGHTWMCTGRTDQSARRDSARRRQCATCDDDDDDDDDDYDDERDVSMRWTRARRRRRAILCDRVARVRDDDDGSSHRTMARSRRVRVRIPRVRDGDDGGGDCARDHHARGGVDRARGDVAPSPIARNDSPLNVRELLTRFVRFFIFCDAGARRCMRQR